MKKPLVLVMWLVGCQGEPSPVTTLEARALTSTVKMRLSIQSNYRVMNQGAGDGGHAKRCCNLRRVPLAQCPWWAVSEWDGSTLSPGGVFWQSGARSSATHSSRIEGPYNCQDGRTDEWEFPAWIDGVPDEVNQEIASIEYWNVPPQSSFPSSVYTFVWKEIDGFVNPDDRFEWNVEVANWVNSCLAASGGGRNGTYAVDGGRVSGGHLCDTRGCGSGDYAVAYTVMCTVSGGGGGEGGSGGGGGEGGGGGGGGSGGGGGGCGSNNNRCFGNFRDCAAVCCGVCERRINCGGASAHKCFE